MRLLNLKMHDTSNFWRDSCVQLFYKTNKIWVGDIPVEHAVGVSCKRQIWDLFNANLTKKGMHCATLFT